MSLVTWLRQRKTLASATALAVLVATPVTLAVLHTGFPLSEVDLRAWSVWVTNTQGHQTARLNTQIKELDSGVASKSDQFDVMQDGDDIFVHDENVVQRIDPAFATLGQTIEAPGTQVSYGGGRIAIVQPGDGKLWVLDATTALQFDPTLPPTVVLGAGGKAIVALDGTVVAVSTKTHRLLEFHPGQGEPQIRAEVQASDFELTAVGARGVVLDTATNRVIFSDGSSTIPGEKVLRLQQPGPDRGSVVVATATGLLQLNGGGVAATFASGVTGQAVPEAAAAPVVLGSCLHGAWTAGRYLSVCDGSGANPQNLGGLTDQSRLEFRVNRAVIALNDTAFGKIWAVQDGERIEVDANWDLVTPPQEEEEDEEDQQSTSLPNFDQSDRDRSGENQAPIARPDQLGARPGKTVILDVLANDSDPDGDVLTVSRISGLPESSGKVELIDGGRALQFVPSATASGTVSFRYAISDGRPGGTAESEVHVAVRAVGSVNNPPKASGTSAIVIESGGTISYNVLADWYDPDGDDLILSSAVATGSVLVRFSPDGLVTFTQLGSELGPVEVKLVITDGVDPAEGTLIVDVKAPGSTKPIAVPDFASAGADRAVEVSPLANDISPSGLPLTLSKVTALGSGVAVQLDTDRGVVTLTGGLPGSFYLEYEVLAGTASNTGLIRFEVTEDPGDELAPIAVKDTAYLRPDQPVTLAVLANDVSPSGAVLAVQRVDIPDAASALSVELLSSTLVRITAPSGMTDPVEFHYTISDGKKTATAAVSVVPIPELTRHQAPIAVGDATKVRVGDIASVSVLDNDFHPDGARMLLDPELVQASVGDGLAFVTGDRVRLQSPTEPGQYSVTYRVTDAFNESATARVVFLVVARDDESNEAPLPRPITARVFQDATLKISIPLDGIDPEGDSVTLTSVGGPTLGSIVASDSSSFTYQAFADPAAGTDSFSYEVSDAFGASASGTVRIAVIPQDGVFPPSAVPDEVMMRPDRVSTIPVLANDSDPNGYQITLLRELLEVEKGITAKVEDDSVVVTSTTPGTFDLRYQLSNGHGPPVEGVVSIEVSADAPLQPPVAFDHQVEPKTTYGKHSIKVDVLRDAQNPGGLRSDLVVSVEGPNEKLAEVNDDGTITVQLGDSPQAIAYRLTNEVDGLSARAFILVPAYRDSEPPRLKKDLKPQTVSRDGTITWTLDEILDVPSGRPVTLVDPGSATAGGHDSTVPLAVDETTLRYTAGEGFGGKTVVTFKVSDGGSAPATTIRLPLTVGDKDLRDVDPVVTDQVIEVEPDGARVELDLHEASSHPNPALESEFVFENLQGPDGPLRATLSGSRVSAWSDESDLALAPAVYTYDVRLGDRKTPATLTVKIVASKKPLPQAVEDVLPEGRSTTSYSIPVLDNDFNPFGDGKPLTVVGVDFEGDSLGASPPNFTSTAVTLTTSTAKSGTISLIYTVRDAAAREVQGRVTIVVASAPEPVTSTVLSNPTSQTVTAVFQPPASSNGAEITSYTVRISGNPGTDEQLCAAGANCTFAGRTNGTVQTVEVGATNKVGTTWSTQSTITPYGTPSAPTNPVLSTNSSTATATITPTWSGPADAGGGNITYHWEFTTAPGGGNHETTSTSGFGTTVGAGDYTFQVRACNPGGCSAYVSASRHISNPPPSGYVSDGGNTGGENGLGQDEHRLRLNYSNIPAGSYTIACYADGTNGGTAPYHNQSMSLSGNGSVVTNCQAFASGPGDGWFMIEIVGLLTTPHFPPTWTND